MLIARIVRTWIDCLRQPGGMAATEFALIAPLMLTLYFGVTELADGLMANTKAASVASTAADLVAQNDKLCNAEMTDIFSALNSIMFPYPTGATTIIVTSLIDAGSNRVKVAWSDAQHGTPRTVNAIVPIPSGLVTSGGGGSVILAEVTYNYSSPAGQLIYGSVPMTDIFYVHPRRVLQVARTANTC